MADPLTGSAPSGERDEAGPSTLVTVNPEEPSSSPGRSSVRRQSSQPQMGPRSSYYTGPPGPGSAFGTAPAGVIGRDRPREVIRVERDYTLGELCQFHPTFPLELEGRIAPVQFGETINDLNEILIRAHNSGWAAFDNVLAVLTLWISPLVVGSKYNREMKELRSLLDRVNKQLFNPAGLNVRDPAEAAFLFLEIEYF